MSQNASTTTKGHISTTSARRRPTVYDAVAGCVGNNGFLDADEVERSTKALAPEEVLLRRIEVNESGLRNIYNAEEQLKEVGQELPDSDLLKAIHTYASDFYDRATPNRGRNDFKSLDGTALMALGCLLEEAARSVLGENGDMALVEPRGLEYGRPETSLTQHQIQGTVRPERTPSPLSDASEFEGIEEPPKKRRR